MRVVILAAYDGLTFGDCTPHRYLNPRFYNAENITALKAEYSEFVLHLFRRYSGTGRRFVISNWEGDNAIYCGGAYSHGVDEKFRGECDLNYSSSYNGKRRPRAVSRGMRLWLRTRQQGMKESIGLANCSGCTVLRCFSPRRSRSSGCSNNAGTHNR